MHEIIVLSCVFLTNLLGGVESQSCGLWSPEVERLREYITINTSPWKDLAPAVSFWRRLAKQQDIEMRVLDYVPSYPVIVLRWPGSNSSLPSILLISQMDVVSACFEDGWTYYPFSAHINEKQEIVGRGTQNMKTIAIQHYEAMSNFKKNNVTLLRDVYMVITPDGASGSQNGMARFVKSYEYRRLNAGVALGVGGPTANAAVAIFYQDKTQYIIEVLCYGKPSHSALPSDSNMTMGAACDRFTDKFNQYKQQQYKKSLTSTDFNQYTVMNFIGVKAVYPERVVTSRLTLYFAAYLAHNMTLKEFKDMIQGWAKEAGRVKVSTYYQETRSYVVKTDDSNPYWVEIKRAFKELHVPYKLYTSPTTSDTTFVIKTKVPAFGISPLPHTEPLVNGVNERVSISVFCKGITVFQKVISRLANLGCLVDDQYSKYLITSIRI